MTGPENQHTPEHRTSLEIIDETEWNKLVNYLNEEVVRLKELGIDVGFILVDDAAPGSREHAHQSDKLFFPASVGKLFLAEAMVVAQWEADKKITYPAKLVDRTGGGELDRASLKDRLLKKEYTVTAGEAIARMLDDSSNTSIRLIAEEFGDGGEFLRQIYHDLGYKETTLEAHPNGRFNLGDTTPEESLHSLHRLLSFPATDPDNPLAGIAADALWSNKVISHGTRQGIRPGSGIAVANKSGEYPGDKYGTPAVRNDVFVITNGKQQLSGAFFATGNKQSMREADEAIKRLGIEIARALGYVDDRLGATALQETVKPPEV